jgi:hypothetical protein
VPYFLNVVFRCQPDLPYLKIVEATSVDIGNRTIAFEHHFEREMPRVSNTLI